MVSKIYLVNPRGFCFGVERAIQVARQSAMLYKNVYVIEDVVHNSRIAKELSEEGIHKVASISDVPTDSTFMISAHGMSPNILKDIDKSINVIDGTCSIVATIQKMIQRDRSNGKKIILIGKRDHAEIRGYVGVADHKDVYVVYSEIDIELLPDLSDSQVSCYSQTTLPHDIVNNLFKALQNKIPHIEAKDTETLNVCNATQNRQNAIIRVVQSYSIDMCIVAGSESSSNTCALRDTAIKNGVPNSFVVDGVSNLSQSMFDGVGVVAISAGASCPEIVVQEIVEYVKNMSPGVIIEEIGDKDICAS